MINKQKLGYYINLYIEALKKDWWMHEKYKWKSVKCFQDNWNINDTDFVSMFRKSIKETDNLLSSNGHLSSAMIIEFTKLDSDRIKKMFIYLFDENKELIDRIHFFKKEADTLRIQLQRKYPSVKNSYQDENAISTYLWLKYPNKYYIYKYNVCRKVSEILESGVLYKKGDYDNNINNSFNLYNEICSYIKNKENLKVILNTLKDETCYSDDKLKIATIDIAYFIFSTEEKNIEEKEIEDWYPNIDEYNPNISADRWIELLKDRTIFDNDSLVVMKRIKNCGGIASCKQLIDKYGLKIIDYNRISSSLAKRVYEKTNCKLIYRQDTKNPIWYFILYVGKYDENNIYFWKLRNELSVALDKIDLSEVLLYEQGYGMSETNQPLNQILYGPPGTGKTYSTKNLIDDIIKYQTITKDKSCKFITFHQSYSYEEFIEGIRPVIDENNEEVKYEVAKGIFKELCLEANKDKENKYVLVIDEINRGNISKIFGELITLIEDDKRIEPNGEDTFENTQVKDNELLVTLPYSKQKFGVPKNLYIIGTMNTSDRSIASVDIALRRRFKFIEMMPKKNLVKDIPIDNNKTFRNIFEALNEKIIILLDRDHQIGHSYFMSNKVSNLEDLKNVWFNEILPLLNEYFYNDWEKLQALLGEASKNNDSFIVVKETKLPFYNYDIEDKVYYDFIDKKDMSNDDNFKSALLKIIEEPKQKEIDEQ